MLLTDSRGILLAFFYFSLFLLFLLCLFADEFVSSPSALQDFKL